MPQACATSPALALSQDFSPTGSGGLIRSADDFVVPEGETWEVQRLRVQGFFQGPEILPVGDLSIFVFVDANGLPGAQRCRFEGVTPTAGTTPGQADYGDFVVNSLGASICPPLTEGRYWLSVVYREDTPISPTSRMWFWQESATGGADGVQWAMRDPEGILVDFGQATNATCPGWQPAGSCLSTPPRQDLCFGLGGDSPVTLVEPIADQFASEDAGFLMSAASNFSDPDGDDLTYTVSNLPPGVSFSASSGRIFGTVDIGASDNSPYDVTVTVTDEDGNSASDSFLILVADNEVADFRFERLWPVLQQSWYFGNTAPPIAVEGDRLYVANDQFCQIQQFTLDGFLVGTSQIQNTGGPGCNGIEGIGTPTAVAADYDGFVYAIGSGDKRVHKLDDSGNQVIQFGALGNPFVLQPIALSVTRRGCGADTGCVYVAEPGRIHRFSTAGEYFATFATGILDVGGLTATDTGMLFVTSTLR